MYLGTFSCEIILAFWDTGQDEAADSKIITLLITLCTYLQCC